MTDNFRQSKIWKSSRLLILQVYIITKNFPNDLQFKNQIRRFPVLISGNIARSLQEKNPELRSQLFTNIESCLNKLNNILKTANEKGYLQRSVNEILIKEMFEIRKSLKAIQH